MKQFYYVKKATCIKQLIDSTPIPVTACLQTYDFFLKKEKEENGISRKWEYL